MRTAIEMIHAEARLREGRTGSIVSEEKIHSESKKLTKMKIHFIQGRTINTTEERILTRNKLRCKLEGWNGGREARSRDILIERGAQNLIAPATCASTNLSSTIRAIAVCFATSTTSTSTFSPPRNPALLYLM